MTMEEVNDIKRLCIMDFDGTLINSPLPEEGKSMWEKYYNKKFPYIGWWGRPESLDLNVFDIKPFLTELKQFKKERITPNTYIIILTSRIEKLRPQVQAVLDKNNIVADKLDMKRVEGDKGKKLLRYIQEFPDLKVVNVYDDRDIDIQAYEAIRSQIPKGIEFNIYLAKEDTLALTESSRSNNLVCIILDEIKKLI
jgi:hypothetical protein